MTPQACEIFFAWIERCTALAFVAAAVLATSASQATEPMRTPSPDEVVETQLLPVSVKRSVHRLAQTSAVTSPAERLLTAKKLIEAGRLSGDPRTLGYATTLLEGLPPDSPEVLVLRATIEQSNHRFDAARELLDRALTRSPSNPQALLTRATIEHVKGDMAAARADCMRLQTMSPDAATVCIAIDDSLTGANARALASLQQIAMSNNPGMRSWALSLAGDVQGQMGAWPAAAKSYSDSLALDDDLYTRIALADALLAQGLYADASRLLANSPNTDAVLLRRWQAAHGAKLGAADAIAQQITERIEAARLRGETLHAREAAMFALDRGDAAQALTLAQGNWLVQHEPADVRLLAAAARATNDTKALAEAERWRSKTGLRDARLDSALKRPAT